jgi:hypothetical protein
VFAGVALEGTVLSIDDGANATAYGVSGILPSQILEGKLGTPPQAARDFTAALTHAADRAAAAAPAEAPAATQPAAAPAATPATPAAEPKSGSPAQTYPMEDPQPGAPPPP